MFVHKKVFTDIIRWLIYFLEIILFYALERNYNLVPEMFGGRPVILIPTFIAIAIFEKEYVSMVFGIIIGIFLDVDIGGPIGIQTIFLFILGYILGVLFTYFINLNFWTFFLTSLIIISVIIGYRFLFFYIIPGFDNIQYAFVRHLVPSAIYTAVVSPIAYFINRYIAYYARFKVVRKIN
jgi:rod shape-determining protein MreD